MRSEGYQIPQVQFTFRENGEFVTRTSAELFDGKRALLINCLDLKRSTKILLDLALMTFIASLLMMGLL